MIHHKPRLIGPAPPTVTNEQLSTAIERHASAAVALIESTYTLLATIDVHRHQPDFRLPAHRDAQQQLAASLALAQDALADLPPKLLKTVDFGNRYRNALGLAPDAVSRLK